MSRPPAQTNAAKPKSAAKTTTNATKKPSRIVGTTKKVSSGAKSKRAATATSQAQNKPVNLLSGGNPQIAKGEGDAPVQAYIQASPDWKRATCRRLDALITETVPRVTKAVKWNSPFYGVEDQGWIVAFHCFNKYIKVTFFRGSSLRPLPPVESKGKETRYVHIYEDVQPDDAQLKNWLKQTAALPGWKP